MVGRQVGIALRDLEIPMAQDLTHAEQIDPGYDAPAGGGMPERVPTGPVNPRLAV